MADSDKSLTNLRYNQVTQGLEGFGGGYPLWTPLVLVADGGINQLTGDVTAGPGAGSQAASISAATVTGKLITGYVSGAGTVATTDTILQAINKLNGNTALKQATLSNVLSGASVGGAANEELTVAGLLTTSTIYAVTQSVPGGNSVAMIGYTNDTNGSLKIIWTANPGAGAKVVVTFI